MVLAFGLRSSSSYMLVDDAKPDFVMFRSKLEISNECFDTSPTSKLSSTTRSKDGSVSVTRLDSYLKMIPGLLNVVYSWDGNLNNCS